MALNDDLEKLTAISNGLLEAHYFIGEKHQDLPEGKRFDIVHAQQALAPLSPLKDIIRQFINLGLESDALNQQIENMITGFGEYDPLIQHATTPDETTGWLCFKKTIPGILRIRSADTKKLKEHLEKLAPFTPSHALMLFGRQVERLKQLANKETEDQANNQNIYQAFRELYLALYEEEAERKLAKNTDSHYGATAHQRVAESYRRIAHDIAEHKGIPPRFKNLERMKKEFNHLATQTVRPNVRTAITAVISAIIGAALGFGVGFLLGGVTAIPAMFVGAALFGTLAGTGFGMTLVPLITSPIVFFHGKHKINRHNAHRSLMQNEGVKTAADKTMALCQAARRN
jgi:hypothetical protein